MYKRHEWGLYVSYLRDFLAVEIGDLTYDFSRWSPSLLVVGVYLVSTVALVTAAVTNREYVEGRRATFLALAGLTAYGVVLFSYFDNRSLDHVLPYVCLPALLVATIWLGLILDTTTGFTRRTRAAALASGLAVAALAIANVWPAAGHRAEDSLLAYAIPGGNSLSQGIDRIYLDFSQSTLNEAWAFSAALKRFNNGAQVSNTEILSYQGGPGVDNITAGRFADNLSGGAGNDLSLIHI